MIGTILLLGVLVTSCAQMRSGHHIFVPKGENMKQISRRMNVPYWKLQAANPGKNPSLRSEWIFVPLSRGIMGHRYRQVNQTLSSMNLAWPVPSSRRISSNFGQRWGRPHEGIDIPARRGASIVAAADGVVVFSGRMGGYGKITIIAHRGGIFTVYAHAQKNHTRKGQRVKQNQTIAQIGSTGHSTGPHLHFEIRYNSKAINPMMAQLR